MYDFNVEIVIAKGNIKVILFDRKYFKAYQVIFTFLISLIFIDNINNILDYNF